MSTQCDIQAAFSFRHDRTICVDFQGGKITSDAGLIALREFDHRIGFTQSLVDCLHDDRHRSYVVPDLPQLIIQRLYGIVAGYEDQNDANKLRHDGLFQIIAGKERTSAIFWLPKRASPAWRTLSLPAKSAH